MTPFPQPEDARTELLLGVANELDELREAGIGWGRLAAYLIVGVVLSTVAVPLGGTAAGATLVVAISVGAVILCGTEIMRHRRIRTLERVLGDSAVKPWELDPGVDESV